MSDLLPLVAAALQDKVVLDASKEMAILREEREVAHIVEVLRSRNNGRDEGEDEPVVAFASAPFESGEYGANTNLWEIPLKSSGDAVCKLADLRDCHICVGGGFPVASLDDELPNNPFCQGWLYDINNPENGEDVGETHSDVVGVRISFTPHTIWLALWIRGWPQEEWEAQIQADDINDRHEGGIVQFFVDEVASRFPDATVEFKEVSFVVKNIHGAMKRLLPKARKAEVRTERDQRIAEEDPSWIDFYEFVQSIMRERGVQGSPEIFRPQLNLVLDFLGDLGFTERGDDNERDEVITQLVDFSVGHLQEGGIEAFREASTRAVANIREFSRARRLAEGEEELDTADDDDNDNDDDDDDDDDDGSTGNGDGVDEGEEEEDMS